MVWGQDDTVVLASAGVACREGKEAGQQEYDSGNDVDLFQLIP
uniref:Uncharacterized protein n=1 Tax=Leersia perrieri TaxID=77586 RepID=A0A0D9XZN2_9ORYZ